MLNVHMSGDHELAILARELHGELRSTPGFGSVGIGAGVLHVYVEDKDAGAKIPATFKGVEVKTSVIGKVSVDMCT